MPPILGGLGLIGGKVGCVKQHGGACLREEKMEQSPVKILVVEDHRELLQFLGLALTMLGCEAVLASSGIEALHKLAGASPDLVIVDLHMPEMDGFELTRTLKQEPLHRDIPVLAVTGLSTPEVRRLCKNAGCDGYMAKPFSLQQLTDRITRLLGAHRLGTTAPRLNHDEEPAPRNFNRYRYLSTDDFQAQKLKKEGF
ncbi:MAG: response regulator [Deltaproteobacteria bacterium]|nr:response regulator [Deltaproteobacteria bacterium]